MRLRRRMLLVLAALLVTLGATSTLAATRAGTGGASDRLERFRELASSRLALGDLDPDNPTEAYRDIYALLDDEIVESLASGGVFASSEFLQDRLDAFGDAWGGAQFRLTRLGRLVVGAFRLTEAGAATACACTARCATRRRCWPRSIATAVRASRRSQAPASPSSSPRGRARPPAAARARCGSISCALTPTACG